MMAKVKKQKLTPEAKARVAIAKDALSQLNVWKAKKGVYVQFETELPKNEDLKKILPKIAKNCEVCAKGALFLSYVRKYNNVNTNDVLNPDSCPTDIDEYELMPYLEKYFDYDQLDAIECAFEGWGHYNNTMDNPHLVERYREEYPDPTKRLTVILKNIIKNDGDFVPSRNKKGKLV